MYNQLRAKQEPLERLMRYFELLDLIMRRIKDSIEICKNFKELWNNRTAFARLMRRTEEIEARLRDRDPQLQDFYREELMRIRRDGMAICKENCEAAYRSFERTMEFAGEFRNTT